MFWILVNLSVSIAHNYSTFFATENSLNCCTFEESFNNIFGLPLKYKGLPQLKKYIREYESIVAETEQIQSKKNSLICIECLKMAHEWYLIQKSANTTFRSAKLTTRLINLDEPLMIFYIKKDKICCFKNSSRTRIYLPIRTKKAVVFACLKEKYEKRKNFECPTYCLYENSEILRDVSYDDYLPFSVDVNVLTYKPMNDLETHLRNFIQYIADESKYALRKTIMTIIFIFFYLLIILMFVYYVKRS